MSKASDVVRKLEGWGAVVSGPSEPVPAGSPTSVLSVLQGCASLAMPKERAAVLLNLFLGQPGAFMPSALGGVSPADAVGALMNLSFQRACAESGVWFCLGPDGLIHRVEPQPAAVLPAPDTEASESDFWLEPPWFAEFSQLVAEGQPVLLIGPAGCGKTRATEAIFAKRGQQLHIVQCTPRSRADDLEGKDELVRDGDHVVTQFTPAAPAIASRDGHGLLLDEADAAPAAAMYSIYRLLDGGEMHIVRAGLDSVIPRHADFRIVGTQNTEGRGDERGLYHARSYQDEAFLDRWGNTVRVGYLEPDQEVIVLRKRTGISSAKAQRLLEAAAAMRKAHDQDEIMFAISMRRTLAVAANLAAGRTPEASWLLACLNRATASDASKMRDVLQRIYGVLWRKA